MSSQGSSIQHDEIAELLGVYALDALDSDERDLVEKHLQVCPRCSAEVARHHEVAGLIANSGGEAPPQIWDKIAEQLGMPDEVPDWEKIALRLPKPSDIRGETSNIVSDEAETTEVESTKSGVVVPLDYSKKRSGLLVKGVSLIASAAAVLAVFLGIQVNHLNSKVSNLQAAASKPLYTQAVQAALEEPTTRRISLTPKGQSVSGAASVTIAMTTSGQDYIIAQDLSTLPTTKTYQLWGQVNGKFVSLGLLGSKPSIIPFVVSPNTPVDLFAITAEPAGGVVQPTSAPVVQGTVNL